MKAREAAQAGALEFTGNLGDVMKESIRIASTYAKVFIEQNEKVPIFFSNSCDYSLELFFTFSTTKNNMYYVFTSKFEEKKVRVRA